MRRITLVAIVGALASFGLTGAATAAVPEWHGDFRHGPASIDRSDPRRQYEFIQTCHSPVRFSVCEGATDTRITVVRYPVKDDKYAARYVLRDDGIKRCRRASNGSVKRNPSAATTDGCKDPLFNGRERAELGGYRYPDGDVRELANGDNTHDVFYVMFRKWPSGHPGEKWCIFWQTRPHGAAIHCNRNEWRLITGESSRERCRIVADGTPPLDTWIRFTITVKWRSGATGSARASIRSLSSAWGGKCAVRNVRILEGGDPTVYPKWGYYRHWGWEHDVSYVIDGVVSRPALGR
jgi:hypothetical protein